MTLSRYTRGRLLFLASVAAPVLGAQAMRLLGAGGPSASAGAVAPAAGGTAAPAAMVREPSATPEQTRAMQWLRLRAADRSARCPMGQLAALPIPQPTTPDLTPTTDPVPKPGVDPAKVLAITAILGGEDGGLATINGKVYGLGAVPLEGWKITLIDRDQWLVQVTGEDGRVIDLHMKHPDRGR